MALPKRPNDVTAALNDLRLASDRRLAGNALALLLVPAIWFIRSDFLLFANDWNLLRQRLLLRVILVLVPAVGFVVMRAVRTRTAYSRAVFWLALLIAAVTLGLNVIRPPGSGLPLRTPMLVLCILYFAMPDSPIRQCAAPLGMSIGLMALRLTRLTGGGIDEGGDIIAIGALNVLGILAVARRARLDTATSAVVGELRTLQEIIPICSHCRKLRSEVGDWQQLERYFQERGDALFSHGICPDCLAAIYPNEE